ncbi:MAG: acid stress-induced BolA-like protein IbaG/YrbA [Pseudohongiellaceae bacterium]|jgi:acid stress-induced BolA-like protein IbaG/YrbA
MLDTNKIETLLEGQFSGDEIVVDGGDGKYQVSIVSDFFAGLNQVKRQQAVYKILNEHIASGAIHAVSMRLKTPDES